jgi:hypothetical protein
VEFRQSILQFVIKDPPFESIGKYQFGIKLGYKQYESSAVSCMKLADV